MSSINSIHHLNFVVKNLELSVKHFSGILDQQPIYDELPNRKVKTARFTLGDSFIVLVQPLGEQGEVAEILKSRGEGLFLLSLGVDNLFQMVDCLSNKNIGMDNKGPRKGLMQWQVWDVEQTAGLGPILQICQD